MAGWSRSIPNTVSATNAFFTISRAINQQGISAEIEDGVPTLTLPKAKEAQPWLMPRSCVAATHRRLPAGCLPIAERRLV